MRLSTCELEVFVALQIFPDQHVKNKFVENRETTDVVADL